MANTKISGANVIAAASGHIIPIYSGTPDEAPQAVTAASIAALASGGGAPIVQLPHITGKIYPAFNTFDNTDTGSVTADMMMGQVHVFAHATAFNRMGFYVTTGGGGGALGQIAIYESGADGFPTGAPLFEDEFDCTSTGLKEATISFTPDVGSVYWVFTWFNTDTISVGFGSFGSVFEPFALLFGQSTPDAFATYTGVQVAAAYGSFPSNPADSGDLALITAPLNWLRKV